MSSGSTANHGMEVINLNDSREILAQNKGHEFSCSCCGEVFMVSEALYEREDLIRIRHLHMQNCMYCKGYLPEKKNAIVQHCIYDHENEVELWYCRKNPVPCKFPPRVKS